MFTSYIHLSSLYSPHLYTIFKAFTEKDKDTSELDALEDLNAMNYMHWTLVLVQIRQRLPVGALNGGDNAPFT